MLALGRQIAKEVSNTIRGTLQRRKAQRPEKVTGV